MQNAIVAKMFDDIADYMEVAGENVFKTKAYRKAAEAVANLTRPIEEVAEAGELETVPGLGQATAQKVREFLATGKVRYLERLRDEYPIGLLELLSVPNLGPKKVHLLYNERGISSIEQLKAAIEGNQLEGLPGFGPKTIQNICQGLERMAEMSKHLPLGDATRATAALFEALQNMPGVSRVAVAGAMRRGCDTVEDLHFVVATEQCAYVSEAFADLPSVLGVSSQTEGEVHAQVRPGIDAYLHCTDESRYGSILFRATASAAHWREAETRAAARGITLDNFATEAELYAALGASYIPPELREDGDAWHLAEQGSLPELLKLRDIRGDLHMHSTWSDGVATIRLMAEAARQQGYSYFAVTDHSKALAMANGLNAERLREQAIEIAEVQADFPDVKILRGIECDIMRDGSLDLDDEILHELDVVVASVHSAFSLDEATQTERVIRAVSHPAVDILAHPTGRVLGVRPGYYIDIPAVIAAARAANTALEINASERLDLSDANSYRAREAGVLLSIDSDAHSPRMLPNVALGVATARRAWCRRTDILNAKSTEELVQWLQRPEARP